MPLTSRGCYRAATTGAGSVTAPLLDPVHVDQAATPPFAPAQALAVQPARWPTVTGIGAPLTASTRTRAPSGLASLMVTSRE